MSGKLSLFMTLACVGIAAPQPAPAAPIPLQRAIDATFVKKSNERIEFDGHDFRFELAHIQRRPDAQVITGRFVFVPPSGQVTTVDYRIKKSGDRIEEMTMSPVALRRTLLLLQSGRDPGVLLVNGDWRGAARFLVGHIALNIPDRPAGPAMPRTGGAREKGAGSTAGAGGTPIFVPPVKPSASDAR